MPILLIAGYRIQRASMGPTAFRWFVYVAVPTAALACLEGATQISLFGRNDVLRALARDGVTRAVLASDQALVLGCLLACAIPMSLVLSARARMFSILLLLAGIYATGSRGPLVIGAMLAAVVLVPPLARAVGRSRWLTTIAIVAVAVVAYLSITTWSAEVLGASGEEYSANYRWALYATLPGLLSSVPFGYGLGTLPAGVWLVASQAFGIRDLVQTLDSELVYSAFTFGCAGIAVVIAAFLIAVRTVRFDLPIGLTATALSLLGFSIALHAWDSLGGLWILITGMAMSVNVGRKNPASTKGRRVGGNVE
ncbi:hypothetical protein [Microbacterium sp. Leaf288]|uniref:hypothetical protein n=1 Tax=Microbacterium sp. Leaf288 TaxID=1736323 RepID=UPI0012F7F3E9|nr:hypothetical protein [Microbacterium sp. Leaf288]